MTTDADAALTEAARNRIPVPDEGSLEADLLALAAALTRTLADPLGQAVLRVLAVGGRQPSPLHTLGQQFWSDRTAGMSVVVHRAVDRSELPPETDSAQLLNALAAPICYQALILGRDRDVGDAVRAARVSLAAARAGLFADLDPSAKKQTTGD